MSKPFTLVAALAAIISIHVPKLASANDLVVGGTIRPASCVPQFSDAGTIDYGQISTDSLNADIQTDLPMRTVELTITCSEPTSVMLKFRDEEAGSAVQGLVDNGNVISGANAFGLGMAGGISIGSWVADLRNVFDNTNTVRTWIVSDDASTWAGPYYTILASNNDQTFAVARSGGQASPGNYRSVRSSINIRPHIRPANELNLEDDIMLSGHLSLEMSY